MKYKQMKSNSKNLVICTNMMEIKQSTKMYMSSFKMSMDKTKKGSQYKSRVNFVKPSRIKLVIWLCMVLLLQELLPDGWKTCDNFKGKNHKNQKNDKKQKYQTKYKNQKNCLNVNCDRMDGKSEIIFRHDENIRINAIIFKSLKDWAIAAKLRNKTMKEYNGNRSGTVNIVHWNLGSTHWERKREEIQLLADESQADFIFISEANLFADTPEHQIDIDGYNIIKAKTMETLKYSRIVLLW